MKNLDVIKQRRDEFKTKLGEAIAANNPDQLAEAFDAFAESMQEIVVNEARGIATAQDVSILAQRGVRQLTETERNFYEQVISAMRSGNPKQALSTMTDTFPKTTIDSIFDDLQHNHPLLDAISFQNTTLVTEWLINQHEAQLAQWGTLDAEIVKEISSSFGKVTMNIVKLTAFIPVSKSMLDLGAEWLDRYVRAILVEALALGLEEGLINGTGNNQPIGMSRQVGEGVTVVGGVYPQKALVPLNDLTPATYGAFIATHLATTDRGNPRVVNEVLMVCNPKDYLRRIMPATTMLAPDGTYISNVFPFPTRVVQSVRVTEGEAIIGIANRYFAGAGMGKDGKIDYSDEYHFLEDERMYLIKLYANGMPMDNVSFVRANIANLSPLAYRVLTESITPAPDATLSALTVGSLTLAPTFSGATHYYAVATSNNSNAVTATATDSDATIAIKVNGDSLTNGAAPTWDNGENIVEITVTNDAATCNYIIAVAKS